MKKEMEKGHEGVKYRKKDRVGACIILDDRGRGCRSVWERVCERRKERSGDRSRSLIFIQNISISIQVDKSEANGTSVSVVENLLELRLQVKLGVIITKLVWH